MSAVWKSDIEYNLSIPLLKFLRDLVAVALRQHSLTLVTLGGESSAVQIAGVNSILWSFLFI